MKWLSYFLPQIIEERDSPHNGRLTVYCSAGTYYISANKLTQSGGILNTLWKQVARQLVTPQNILILGLGGGSVAQVCSSNWPKARMVGVDIDPVIVELGKKYLNLNRIPLLSIIEADVFTYLPTLPQRFDLIIIDMYQGRKIPPQAETIEFLTAVKNHLTTSGVVVVNRVLIPELHASTVGFERRLEHVFGSFKLLNTSFNKVLLCSRENNHN